MTMNDDLPRRPFIGCCLAMSLFALAVMAFV
jgi:hypothetical protein